MIRVTQVSESTFTVKGHGVHTAFTELTNALTSRSGVQVRVNRFGEADITHIHTVGLFSLAFLLFGSGKKVVSAHVVPESLRGSLIGADMWLPLARHYLRWFYNRADMVFAVSDATKRELCDMGVKAPVEVVYNIVNTANYHTTPADKQRARKKLGLSEKDWVVVGSGQLQPRKRVDSFIQTAARCPDMQFIWVGGMPFGKLAADNGAMQHMVRTAPNNVTVTGVLEHHKVRAYYQAADVFWLPSSQETFGLVVVEAAAAGLPIVLRDIPDYKETFAGFAVMGTEDSFAELLRRLHHDTAFYERYAKKAQRIVERFGAARGVAHVLEVYRRLVV